MYGYDIKPTLNSFVHRSVFVWSCRLKPFTSYKLRMLSTNDVGDSVLSKETEAVTTLQDGKRLAEGQRDGDRLWRTSSIMFYSFIFQFLTSRPWSSLSSRPPPPPSWCNGRYWASLHTSQTSSKRAQICTADLQRVYQSFCGWFLGNRGPLEGAVEVNVSISSKYHSSDSPFFSHLWNGLLSRCLVSGQKGLKNKVPSDFIIFDLCQTHWSVNLSEQFTASQSQTSSQCPLLRTPHFTENKSAALTPPPLFFFCSDSLPLILPYVCLSFPASKWWQRQRGVDRIPAVLSGAPDEHHVWGRRLGNECPHYQ